MSWLDSYFMAKNRSDSERLKKKIFAAETHDKVLMMLTRNDLGRHVENYKAYLEWRQEDLEEGESPGVVLQSLQSWAWFLVSYAQPKKLPLARMKADFDGCIELIWRLSPERVSGDPDNGYWGNGRGIAILKFYPSYLNYLSILSGPYASEKRRLSVDGFLSHTKTQQVLNVFAERLLDGGQ